MSSKKGQAAMEYLMTYGWAILIVAVVIIALYSFGVFSLGGTKPACSPCFAAGGELDFKDHNPTHVIPKNGPQEINLQASTGVDVASPPVNYKPGDTVALAFVIGATPVTFPRDIGLNYDVVG